MKKEAALFIFIFFSVNNLIAQKIRILDNETNSPVSDVYIFNHSQSISVFSNKDGIANLNEFPKSELIYFQHPSYDYESKSFEDLEKQYFKLFLNEKIILFSDVVISANKWQQNDNEISQDLLSITSKNIEFTNPQTSADMLASSGQVFVQKSQYGGGSPSLRGFAANKVLLVIDGVRLNNGIYRSGNLHNVINIDANLLDRTEVIFGPGSVIYGSDALGGVVNFTTIKPVMSKSKSYLVTGSAMIRTSSAAKEKTVHTDISIGRKKWAYLGSISISDFHDLEAGSYRNKNYQGYFKRPYYIKRINDTDQLIANENTDLQKHSGYSLINSINKLSIDIGNYSELNYGFYYSTTSDIPRYDRLALTNGIDDSLIYAEWYYGPQTWIMNSLNFTNYSSNLFYNQMRINLAYQDYQESRNDREFNDSRLRSRTEKVGIITSSIDFEKDLKNNSLLFYGIDGFYNDIKSSGYRKNIVTGVKTSTSTRYPDGGSNYSSLAGYGSFKKVMNEKWNLNFGTRYNMIWLNASTMDQEAKNVLLNDLNIFNHALTGSIGTVYHPNQSTKWSSILSSGFRSPNVDDVGKLFEIDENIVVVPNPDLKPEYVYNAEISFQKNITPNVQFDIVVFHSWLTNSIVRGDYELKNNIELNILDFESVDFRAQVNTEKARIYGGSFRIKGKLSENLALKTTLNINEGHDDSNNEPLRHTTPVFGQILIKYEQKQMKFHLIGNYQFTKGINNIPSSEINDKHYLYTEKGSPGFVTMDFRFGYRLFSSLLEIESGIENILDIHYRTYSSGISGPGRNLYLSLKSNF